MRRAKRAMTPGPFVPRRIKAIQSMAWADAKAQIAIVKQSLADTESFWAANKKDDAVKMVKDSIAKVTAVEEAGADTRSAGRTGGVQAGWRHLPGLPQAVSRAGREHAVPSQGWSALGSQHLRHVASRATYCRACKARQTFSPTTLFPRDHCFPGWC